MKSSRSCGAAGSRILATVLLMAGAGSPGALAQTTNGIAATASPGEINLRAREAIRRGLNWLKTVQKEKGSWSSDNYPALTALPMWAFAWSDHPDRAAVCDKAAAFIAGFAQKDGGIYKRATLGRFGGGLSTYNTAICMTALTAYEPDKYAPIVLRAREYIATNQLAGDSPGAGGFGYGKAPAPSSGLMSIFKGKGRADLSNTSWTLMAMRSTEKVEAQRKEGERADIDWNAAVAFVERLQIANAKNPDENGGFAYTRGGSSDSKKGEAVALSGFGSMTYAGLESLIYARVDRNDPRVRSAVEWAGRHWSVDENPCMGTRGLFYYYNVMSKALSLTGMETLRDASGADIPWKKQLVEKLVAVQQPDGRWINANGQYWEGDAALVTAYTVLALEYALGK